MHEGVAVAESMTDPARTSRSVVARAFATLVLMMAAHALLESARDVLLLQKLSSHALLWSYVAVAVVALAVTRFAGERRLPVPFAAVVATGAALTLGWWLLLPALLPYGALPFYVYVAVLATLLVTRFWLGLAAVFTVVEAKRHYPVVALGGIVGAAVGSGAAALLLTRAPPRALVVVGAATYALAAVVARTIPAAEARPVAIRPAAQARAVDPTGYLRIVTALALLGSASATVVDFLFKSAAATRHSSAELGPFLARSYTAINVVAIAVHLFVAPRILRRSPTHVAAAVLPTLVLATAAPFLVFGAPWILLLAKGSDGALRNSLHRVTSELFFFPLQGATRDRWKATVDALGQRGGQAAGALVVLALLAVGAGARTLAALVVALATAWLVLTWRIREPYLELFRHGLRRGALAGEVPPASADTFQAVLEAFSSRDDVVVCAALDVLAEQGNARLIPGVMVRHVSSVVALRALELLVASGRSDVGAVALDLADHADPAVRIAAFRARIRVGAVRDDELEAALVDPAAELRAEAIVQGLRVGDGARSAALLEQVTAGDDAVAKLALVRALAGEPAARAAPTLLKLVSSADLNLRREALRAMTSSPDPGYLPVVLPLLGERRVLPSARAVVLAVTGSDSSVVEAWLDDESLPRGVRRHLPRTLSAYRTDRAARALVTRLNRERDEVVTFKILRGLGRIVAERPDVDVDRRELRAFGRRALERASTLLAWRVALHAGDGSTPLEKLLVSLLRAKERHALECTLRVQHILHPRAELEAVWRGLASVDRHARDAALELIGSLDADVRVPLAVLLGDGADANRLARLGRARSDRAEALRACARDASEPLSAVAAALSEGREDHGGQ